MAETLIINAFGGPGAGKTTSCHDIISTLKKQGFTAEYVPEYATELVWEKNYEMLDGTVKNQMMIFNEQKRRIDRLMGKVDFIVTDSPLLLNLVYAKEKSADHEKLVTEIFKNYQNFCFFVRRNPFQFTEQGRIHTLSESKEIDSKIQKLLSDNGIFYGKYGHNSIHTVIDNAIKTHKRLKAQAEKRNTPKKPHYTQDELAMAQRSNLAQTLQAMGYALKPEGHGYRGVLHDSFVIPDRNKNEWHWNSKDLHGREPVNCISSILQIDYGYDTQDAYITAIKRLAGTENIDTYEQMPPPSFVKEDGKIKEDIGAFELPEKNNSFKRTIAYLCKTRKLDYEIVSELINQNKIYETKKHHNACFVSFDNEGNPKHAFLRGTYTTTGVTFRGDVAPVDKQYPFSIYGSEKSDTVYCFESSIDAISHATIYKLQGKDYKKDYRISLHGTSFQGLEYFLKNHPHITKIVACLDNDKAGNMRSQKLCDEYAEKGYKILRQTPAHGKDFNEALTKISLASEAEAENLPQEKSTEDKTLENDEQEGLWTKPLGGNRDKLTKQESDSSYTDYILNDGLSDNVNFEIQESEEEFEFEL